MNRSFAILTILSTISVGSLVAMNHDKYGIPCRHDDYASRTPEKHPLLRQDKNLSWQNGLSFDVAETIGKYLILEADKERVRLVCKNWHELFRHPGQSYGNGEHCAVAATIKTGWFGYQKETLDQCFDRLIQRLKNRPTPRDNDSIDLNLREDYITDEPATDKALHTLFIKLNEQNLTSIIKKIDFGFHHAPETFTNCHQLLSLHYLNRTQSAQAGLALCTQFPQLQKLTCGFGCCGGTPFGVDSVINATQSVAQLACCNNLQRLKIDGSSVQFDIGSFFLLLKDHITLKKLDIAMISKPEFDEHISEAAVKTRSLGEMKKHHSLTTLKSRNMSGHPFSPFFLEQLCQHAPNLENLNLCPVNKGLHCLAALNHLKKLSLTLWEPSLSLEELLQTGLPIISLKIKGPKLLDDGFPARDTFLPFAHLEELELINTDVFVDPTPMIARLFSLSPKLKKLKVFLGYLQPSPAFIALLGQIPTLKELSISWRGSIDLATRRLMKEFAQQHKDITFF